MSKTSKKYFDEGFKNEIWKKFVANFKSLNSQKKVLSVLAIFLTPYELNILEKRLAVLNLLRKGLTYNKICEIADVHRSTISFIKKGFIKTKKPKRNNERISKIEFKKEARPRFRRYRYLRRVS